jgi:alanine racemase
VVNVIERFGNRAWVEVDLAAVVANARTVQAAAGGVPLLPMVKADAYGVGVEPVTRALEVLEPWGYGVASLAEGIELRQAGIHRPVVVFTPAHAKQIGTYRAHDLRAVIDRPDVARRWSLPFHLEVDTGMARCGVRWNDETTLAACASDFLEGVFTHFYAADEDPATVERQWERFGHAIDVLPRRPTLVHAANSAGAWRLQHRLDLVRPGIFLYGGRHAPDLPAPQPVVQLRAPVVSLRRIEARETVSYGGTWQAPHDTTIATLAVGYADGVPRRVTGRAVTLIAGGKRPIVGRVTMDFVMVALGEGDQVALGDVATVVGSTPYGEITIDEFAAWADTIAYEALTRLGARVRRVPVGP